MPYHKIYYHFIWATKQRLLLINPANQEPLYAAIRAKALEQHAIVYALNGLADHVHLVVALPPTATVATFIGQVKGASSHMIAHLYQDADQPVFAWQQEYGVVSLSESHLSTIITYVEEQQQRHALNRLDTRLEGLA